MSKSNFMGIVFQAEYGYKGKYYVSGSVRTDGSSRFGEIINGVHSVPWG